MAVSNRALALKPNNADAFHNRSIILERLRRVEEALASVEAALALRPVFAEALNQRGSLLAATVRLDEAIASYDRALAANPNYAEAFNNKGVALAELGESQRLWRPMTRRWRSGPIMRRPIRIAATSCATWHATPRR